MNVVLAIPPLTARVYIAARSGIRCITLLFGLVIALHGTTETAERVRAYTAFTHAMMVRWPHPRRPGRAGSGSARGTPAVG
ncbi:MAG: hypothetical protein ACRDRW_11975 [Pseudonocardiaceae bacterium]